MGAARLGRASTSSIELGGEPAVRRRRRRRRSIDVEVGDDGIVVGDVAIGWPELSLWRAPTDNDDPPGEWRATTPAAGWRADGLDRLVEHGDVEVRRRGAVRSRGSSATSPAPGSRSSTASGSRSIDGAARISEVIAIDRSLRDLPRVGVRFALPVEFDRLDVARPRPRRLAIPIGGRPSASAGGTATVGELAVPFVRPQEYGLHLDTEWFELASPRLGAARRR